MFSKEFALRFPAPPESVVDDPRGPLAGHAGTSVDPKPPRSL
jgi:hypothetical protein